MRVRAVRQRLGTVRKKAAQGQSGAREKQTGGAHRAEDSGNWMGQDTTQIPQGDIPDEGTGKETGQKRKEGKKQPRQQTERSRATRTRNKDRSAEEGSKQKKGERGTKGTDRRVHP